MVPTPRSLVSPKSSRTPRSRSSTSAVPEKAKQSAKQKAEDKARKEAEAKAQEEAAAELKLVSIINSSECRRPENVSSDLVTAVATETRGCHKLKYGKNWQNQVSEPTANANMCLGARFRNDAMHVMDEDVEGEHACRACINSKRPCIIWNAEQERLEVLRLVERFRKGETGAAKSYFIRA